MRLKLILAIIAIISLSVTIFPQLSQVTQMGSNWRKDYKLIPILQEISSHIPENESLVTSSFDPIVLFFIGRQLDVPNNVSSYSSLLEIMEKNDDQYLLVIDGEYNIPRRDIQFNTSEFSLEEDFREIATRITDFSKLHLYQRISNGS